MWNWAVDPTEHYTTAETADLQVVLPVQRPGGEPLLWGARYAPQTAGVKGQAHDRLRVGFNLAQPGPLGYIPQHQGTVLISSNQERSGTRVWLREGAGVVIRERRKDGEVGRERKDKEERVRAASSRKTTGTSARCRGYHAGSCCWHSEGRCGFHSSARCASSLDLYYGTPHFAPHPYRRATGLAACTTHKVK